MSTSKERADWSKTKQVLLALFLGLFLSTKQLHLYNPLSTGPKKHLGRLVVQRPFGALLFGCAPGCDWRIGEVVVEAWTSTGIEMWLCLQKRIQPYNLHLSPTVLLRSMLYLPLFQHVLRSTVLRPTLNDWMVFLFFSRNRLLFNRRCLGYFYIQQIDPRTSNKDQLICDHVYIYTEYCKYCTHISYLQIIQLYISVWSRYKM